MEQTEILYNGRCPICSAEIAQYRKQAERAGAPLVFTDLNAADLSDWHLTPDQATRRLHARQDGRIISGFPAFLILWRALPRMRWLARLLSLPVLRQLAGFGYNRIAAPLLHALHRRREARSS
ncbi:MAG: thiol-disulfide oxidoreductase DCC family protein [Roseinatronobacter sp.]